MDVPRMQSVPKEEDWSGRVVVRFLKENLDQDYEIKNKAKARVNPSTIIAEMVPENDASSPHFESDKLQQEQCGSTHIPDNAETCTIRMDVTLTSQKTNQDVTVSLIRDGNEAASNCLKRMELSLIKKLFKKTKKKKQKGKKQMAHQNNAGPPSCIGVLIQDDDGSESLQEIGSMSNAQFWALSAISSMKLRLEIGDEMEATLPVECNPPTIYSVNAFENFCGEIFPHVPLVVNVKTLFASHAIIDWYANGEQVRHDSPCYVPTLDDVGKSLAIVVTPVRHGYQTIHLPYSTTEAYRYQRKVVSTLPPNTTLKIRKEWLKEPSNGDLRVMSYNILADQNAFTGTNKELPFFPYVSEEILSRSRRFPLILHEILAYQADVICLQEVDSFVFASLLQPALEYYDYQGFYSQKQSSGNNEGCAMFWSLDRFQKVEATDMKTYRISELLQECLDDNAMDSEWNECATPVSRLFAKRKDLKDIVLSKLGHVLQLVKLKDQQGKSILVANTHLFFHPMGSHIRALQLFAVAHQLSKERSAEDLPFLLIGDLNSSVGNAATLILKKELPRNFRDYKASLNNFSWDGNHGAAGYNDDFPALSIPKSAFPSLVNGYSEELPPYTHYIVGFKATIDHILLSCPETSKSCGVLRPKRHAPIPSVEEVTEHQAMPSPNFPSDHISLLCDLEWTVRSTD